MIVASFLNPEHDTTNLKPAASKTTTYWTNQQFIIISIVEIHPQLQYPRQYPLFPCSIAQLVFIDISLFLPIEVRLQIRLVERERRFSNFRGQRAGLRGDGCCTRRQGKEKEMGALLSVHEGMIFPFDSLVTLSLEREKVKGKKRLFHVVLVLTSLLTRHPSLTVAILH